MAAYRLYCRKDGRIISMTIIDAANDAAAVDRVRVRRDGLQYEMWQGGRLVAFLAGGEEEGFEREDIR